MTPPARQVFLLQRKSGKPGAGLGKTTGWIHRATLKMKRVQMLAGVTYERIDDAGLHIAIDGERQVLAVDNVVLCTGQEPLRELLAPLQAAGVTVARDRRRRRGCRAGCQAGDPAGVGAGGGDLMRFADQLETGAKQRQ